MREKDSDSLKPALRLTMSQDSVCPVVHAASSEAWYDFLIADLLLSPQSTFERKLYKTVSAVADGPRDAVCLLKYYRKKLFHETQLSQLECTMLRIMMNGRTDGRVGLVNCVR